MEQLLLTLTLLLITGLSKVMPANSNSEEEPLQRTRSHHGGIPVGEAGPDGCQNIVRRKTGTEKRIRKMRRVDQYSEGEETNSEEASTTSSDTRVPPGSALEDNEPAPLQGSTVVAGSGSNAVTRARVAAEVDESGQEAFGAIGQAVFAKSKRVNGFAIQSKPQQLIIRSAVDFEIQKPNKL